jgi:hypothetical protein
MGKCGYSQDATASEVLNVCAKNAKAAKKENNKISKFGVLGALGPSNIREFQTKEIGSSRARSLGESQVHAARKVRSV